MQRTERSQQGYVLITVLIITIIATLVAFGGISENRLQEQIGGNQQKEIEKKAKQLKWKTTILELTA